MSMAPALGLAAQYATRRACPDRSQLRRWTRAALDAGAVERPAAARVARLVVRFVDRSEARALNRRFRGRDHASNVLTFAYDDREALHADIVLCAPVIETEARAQHKQPRDHYAHLVIHGVLHALGYDHQRARDARRMESLETQILARFRVADPYV
jgi:probable rRNA maturation factor